MLKPKTLPIFNPHVPLQLIKHRHCCFAVKSGNVFGCGCSAFWQFHDYSGYIYSRYLVYIIGFFHRLVFNSWLLLL